MKSDRKTYQDIANIKKVDTPMELKQFWSIIENCQSLTATYSRDYDLMKILAELPIPEIVGFPLRITELNLTFRDADEWTPAHKRELLDLTGFGIEAIVLWTIFQGREFYETALHKPLFLIKRAKEFSGEDIPDHKVVSHALALHIGDEYIHHTDFIADGFKSKMIW